MAELPGQGTTVPDGPAPPSKLAIEASLHATVPATANVTDPAASPTANLAGSAELDAAGVDHSSLESGSETGDPMASIRPELPSPPVLDATIELESGSSDERTLEPPPGLVGRAELETQDSGSFVVPVAEVGAQADLGTYQLESRLGVGGMGEVWRARQPELGRRVALKRLRRGRDLPAGIEDHFKSEARLTAILDHPNIVTVHELGHDQSGQVFYTMQLIEGTPWSAILATGRRSTGIGTSVEVELRDHLDILIEVGRAVGFAHSRGVIHRDIKPGNVMVGDFGEVLLVDWGLAVAVDDSIRLLGEGMAWTLETLPRNALVCGTPAYMSPETARAERNAIGPATDVYLLGAVLFHVLYGRPPHQGRSVKEVITRAKVNAWDFPERISNRLKPWDALLRPIVVQALASDPTRRFADGNAFAEAVRQAIRNYDSAKIASQAQDELAALIATTGDGHEGAESSYRALSGLIAKLQGALDSWPRNLIARQTLAHAQLELARLAVARGDLGLASVSLDAFEQLPPLPVPDLDPERSGRRLTVHPVDGTLVGAPRPSDSLVAAASSNEWVSSTAQLGPRKTTGGSSPGRTVGALELARRRAAASSRGLGLVSPDGSAVELRDLPTGLGLSSVASVEIQQESDESILDENQELVTRSISLRASMVARERELRRRRRAVVVAGSLAAALVVAVIGGVVFGHAAVQRERDRAQAERDKLSEVLVEETANTVEAELDATLEPVLAALGTALTWAAAGELDSDDPRELNRYLMPLLGGAGAATSMLRADSEGREYMLLNRGEQGWKTRTTVPGQALELRDWTPGGELEDLWSEARDYDPLTRPWYLGGAALRASGGGFHWTDPYRFFTTKELGVSLSAPVESPSGRAFVIAFDVTLGDLSLTTEALPRGIERGQVFVLDDQLRVLALPRETAGLAVEDRDQLLLRPMLELELDAPISQAATAAWRERGDDGPFHLELGDGLTENYWAGFRRIERVGRPRVWIGVVVPESHFLDE